MLTVLAAEGDDELLSGVEGHGDEGIGELTPAPLFEGKRGVGTRGTGGTGNSPPGPLSLKEREGEWGREVVSYWGFEMSSFCWRDVVGVVRRRR